MRAPLLQVFAGLWFPAFVFAAGDSGGIVANLSPQKVYPGDLVTFQVTMNREDYGEFVLHIPSHPRLHLVSREKIPLGLVDGRYRQGERLVLQAVSSGPLALTGMKAELTEAGGVRAVELPELELKVLPFDSADENPAPETFPEAAPAKRPRFPLVAAAVGILAAGFLLVLLLRTRRRKEGAA